MNTKNTSHTPEVNNNRQQNKNSLTKVHLKKFSGFTMVELIIVITILAILGVIGFTNIANYSSNARDSERISTLKNIDSGLTVFSIKAGGYPFPETNMNSPTVSTGSIGGTIYSYLGVIGDNTSRIANINKTPTDPLSKTNYIYGVTKDQKYYQIATVLENPLSYNDYIKYISIVSKTYANSIPYQAKVNGNYLGYLKFNSGSEVWIANIPSLIWNNTGSSVYLFATGTYFVTNKQSNLPYSLDGSTPIQNRDANQLIQDITGTGIATLTGANITSITSKSGVSSFFTGALLASFGGNISQMQNMVLGDGTSSGGSGGKVYLNCTGTTQSGYTISPLSHGLTTVFTKTIANGTGSLSATCTNGVLSYGSEGTICTSGYAVSGNSCLLIQNGVCNNTSPLGCAIGSAINDNGQASCGTTRTWNCSGVNGGGNSVQCSYGNGSCCTPNGNYTYGSCSVSGACGQTGYQSKYDSCGNYVGSISCSTTACTPCAAHTRTCVPSGAPSGAYCSANIPSLASGESRSGWQGSGYVDTVWNYPGLPNPKYNYCGITVTCNNGVITQNVCTW